MDTVDTISSCLLFIYYKLEIETYGINSKEKVKNVFMHLLVWPFVPDQCL